MPKRGFQNTPIQRNPGPLASQEKPEGKHPSRKEPTGGCSVSIRVLCVSIRQKHRGQSPRLCGSQNREIFFLPTPTRPPPVSAQ